MEEHHPFVDNFEQESLEILREESNVRLENVNELNKVEVSFLSDEVPR